MLSCGHRATMDYFEELVEAATERKKADECEALQFVSGVEFKDRSRLSKQAVMRVVSLIEDDI